MRFFLHTIVISYLFVGLHAGCVGYPLIVQAPGIIQSCWERDQVTCRANDLLLEIDCEEIRHLRCFFFAGPGAGTSSFKVDGTVSPSIWRQFLEEIIHSYPFRMAFSLSFIGPHYYLFSSYKALWWTTKVPHLLGLYHRASFLGWVWRWGGWASQIPMILASQMPRSCDITSPWRRHKLVVVAWNAHGVPSSRPPMSTMGGG